MTAALPYDIDEVSLAALLGEFCAIQRHLNTLHELALVGRVVVPADFETSRVKVEATINALCDELHELRRDAPQLPLFTDEDHATH